MPSLTARSTEMTLCRIRAEFWEMPGLKLTPMQARRLWGLDPESCAQLLDVLVGDGFLVRTRDGAFVRRDRCVVRSVGL